jgi:hypothetical protein
LVKWKGYDEVEASWKAADELTHCRELIDEYETVHQQIVKVEEGQGERAELAIAWAMQFRVDGNDGRRRGRQAVTCSYVKAKTDAAMVACTQLSMTSVAQKFSS